VSGPLSHRWIPFAGQPSGRFAWGGVSPLPGRFGPCRITRRRLLQPLLPTAPPPLGGGGVGTILLIIQLSGGHQTHQGISASTGPLPTPRSPGPCPRHPTGCTGASPISTGRWSTPSPIPRPSILGCVCVCVESLLALESIPGHSGVHSPGLRGVPPDSIVSARHQRIVTL